jgi:hypothetical protein
VLPDTTTSVAQVLAGESTLKFAGEVARVRPHRHLPTGRREEFRAQHITVAASRNGQNFELIGSKKSLSHNAWCCRSIG